MMDPLYILCSPELDLFGRCDVVGDIALWRETSFSRGQTQKSNTHRDNETRFNRYILDSNSMNIRSMAICPSGPQIDTARPSRAGALVNLGSTNDRGPG